MYDQLQANNDTFSVIAPRCSGIVSTISSSIIIFIIMKTNQKLSSIYHRIIFGMSFTDILSSISIGLTTIPMTRDDENLQHQGTKLGNASTCTAQGMFIVYGFSALLMYNGSLWIYYCCSVGFQINERKMKKVVEPFLHLIPIVGGLINATIPLLKKNGYGASNERPFCGIQVAIMHKYIRVAFLLVAGYMFTAVLASLVIILLRIRRVRRELLHGITPPRHSSYLELRKNVRVVLIQASAYLLTYLISNVVAILILSTGVRNEVLVKIQLTVFPLQGLFNCIVFISHKVHSYKRLNDHYSTCEVIGMLVRGEYEEPFIMTNLALIREDRELERMNLENALNQEERAESRNLSTRYGPPDTESGMHVRLGSVNEERDESFGGFDIPSITSTKDDEVNLRCIREVVGGNEMVKDSRVQSPADEISLSTISKGQTH